MEFNSGFKGLNIKLRCQNVKRRRRQLKSGKAQQKWGGRGESRSSEIWRRVFCLL